ncbi:MAG: SDR family NAD(P)-dependent oxidoreductase [Anaerolineae bacterium]
MIAQKMTAVITGATGGIGREVALHFARKGYNIACVDMREEDAAPLIDEINGIGIDNGVQAIFIRTDVTSSGDVTHMVERTVEAFGSLDVLVNCAGVGIRGSFLDVTEEVWDKTIAVNLKGTFLCTQKTVAWMVRTKTAGSVVNISSICGTVADRFSRHVPYEASKGGVDMLTKTVAFEMAEHGIRVNAVAPGRIQTPLLNSDPEHVSRVSSFIPLGHYGEPADVAGAVYFLASAEAKYITGTVLYVDGGWTIQ